MTRKLNLFNAFRLLAYAVISTGASLNCIAPPLHAEDVTINIPASATSAVTNSTVYTGETRLLVTKDATATVGLIKTGNSSYTGGTVITNVRAMAGITETLTGGALTSGSFGTGPITLVNATLQNYNGARTISNNIVLQSNSSFRAGWNTTLTIAGNISGSGQLQIANDSGTVVLSGNNTYTGGTLVGAGINSTEGQGKVRLGSDNALGAGAVTFSAATSTLDMFGYDATISYAFGDYGTISNSSTTVSTLTMSGIRSDLTYAGKIAGNIQLVLNGNTGNFYRLSGANTYTGGTEITSVRALVNVDEVTDASGNVTSGSFGTGVVTLTNGTIQSGGLFDRNVSNDIFLTNGAAGSLRAGNSKILTVKGDISGAGQLQIASDSGAVVLSGNNTYTGGTLIGGGINSTGGQGTVQLGSDNALGTGPVSFGSNSSTLNLAGYNLTVGGLDNSKPDGTFFTGNAITNSGAATSTLTLNVAQNESRAFGGTINSNKIALVKQGEGTQSFASAQTFDSVTIEKGTLALSGSGALTASSVSVSAQAVLTTDPTDGIYHSLANASFDDGGILSIQISSMDDYSRFNLTTAPNFNADLGFIGIQIDEDLTLPTSASFLVSQSNPGAIGDMDLESWLSTGNRYEWNLLWNAGASSMYLQRDSSAVPEPSAWALLTLGLCGTFWLRRKTSQKAKRQA